jgi:SAM-dependent methyltransferase
MNNSLQNTFLTSKKSVSYRERKQPQRGDPFYLHLSDLLCALRQHGTESPLRVLDFGCGESPYQFLFPKATYRRADLGNAPDLDFQIDGTGRVNAPTGEFDLVISTQVLEHCLNPELYLTECHRVLRKSGRLLLSTHGLFEEHGSPFDFHRWTEDGLRSELVKNGFRVSSISRLTLGPRAGLLMLQRSVASLTLNERSWLTRSLWVLIRRSLTARIIRQQLWDPLIDRAFPDYRIMENGYLPGDCFYIALLVAAETY